MVLHVRKIFQPILLLLALIAGLWWHARRDYTGYSPRAARRIIAEAGLEKAVSLSVTGDLVGWQHMPCTDSALLAETLTFLQSGAGRKMDWHGAPTPEEIWVFTLADGRQASLGWWNVERPEYVHALTITGDVYGDFPADGDRLVTVDRHGFYRLRKRILQTCPDCGCDTQPEEGNRDAN